MTKNKINLINMNRLTLFFLIAITILLSVLLPAADTFAAKEKTFTGIVIKNDYYKLTFRTTSAATYTAVPSGAVLVRKNGSPMQFSEILIGDKIEVRGTVWNDNSINASYVRNMSLYAHTGTFTGKITSINPSGNNFTLDSKAHGSQTITTSPLTSYVKGSKAGMFRDIELGASVIVKGTWERNSSNVTARLVEITVRLINIDVTGKLVMKNSTHLTIAADNMVLYGVDISKAKIQNKFGKTLAREKLNMGDTVRVQGKHIAEQVLITATTIKDLSVVK